MEELLESCYPKKEALPFILHAYLVHQGFEKEYVTASISKDLIDEVLSLFPSLEVEIQNETIILFSSEAGQNDSERFPEHIENHSYPERSRIRWIIKYQDIFIPLFTYYVKNTEIMNSFAENLSILRSLLDPFSLKVKLRIIPSHIRTPHTSIPSPSFISLIEKEENSVHLYFMINCYLVAVGFRTLYIVEWDLEKHFSHFFCHILPYFPSLTLTDLHGIKAVHSTFFKPPSNLRGHRNLLGSLLGYEEPMNVKESFPDLFVKYIVKYKNLRIPLYVSGIFYSTKVSQISNTLIKLKFFLNTLNMGVVSHIYRRKP